MKYNPTYHPPREEFTDGGALRGCVYACIIMLAVGLTGLAAYFMALGILTIVGARP